MICLEGENIKLRAMEPSDLDDLYEWENDPENWFVSHTRTPYSKHVLRQFIENAHRDLYEIRQMRMMIQVKSLSDIKNRTIGAIDLFDFEPYHMRAGVGILIARKEHRRHGFASEALSLLIDYAFNSLGLHQLYCNIASDNEASLKLFMKSGFHMAGEKKEWLRKPGSWTDEYLLQLINPADSAPGNQGSP